MADTFGGGDRLEKDFAGLESASTSMEVENKLAALKAKLGK